MQYLPGILKLQRYLFDQFHQQIGQDKALCETIREYKRTIQKKGTYIMTTFVCVCVCTCVYLCVSKCVCLCLCGLSVCACACVCLTELQITENNTAKPYYNKKFKV